jgi:nitrogen regulatory protein P-II 1
MKKIECYIQPYNLDTVAEHLVVEGVRGMSVSEVKGFGVQRGFKPSEGAQAGVKLLPKLKIEMVVLEKDVERIIDDLQKVLRTGRVGDGKIFVSPVDDAIRTRTGERGRDAIQ